MKFQDYVDEANKKITVIMQIEHVEGVKNIDAIVKVPGLDAIIIGPYDLSGSMGKIGKVNDPEVQQKIDTARKAGLNAGLAVGIFTTNPEEVKSLSEKGYTLIAVGIDTMIFGQALNELLRLGR